MPTVSVIMPCFNYGRFVGAAIQSVLAQTYQDFELLLVDDGSTDGTERVVRPYLADPRLGYLRQPNRGPAAARNLGVSRSGGQYVAFLDADDLWFPPKLARQVGVLNARPEVGVVYSAVVYVDERQRPLALKTRWTQGRPPEDLPRLLMVRNALPSSTVLVRRACWEAVGGFDEDLVVGEDLDLWRRLAMRYPFQRVNEPLAAYRLHGRRTSANHRALALGHLRLLFKLQTDTPSPWRADVPQATFVHRGIAAWHLLRAGELAPALLQLVKLAGAGLRHPVAGGRGLRALIHDRQP